MVFFFFIFKWQIFRFASVVVLHHHIFLMNRDILYLSLVEGIGHCLNCCISLAELSYPHSLKRALIIYLKRSHITQRGSHPVMIRKHGGLSSTGKGPLGKYP